MTRVSARLPPPTTIRANFQPQIPYTPRGPTFSYEAPQRRSWPHNAAIISLAVIVVMLIGGLIAAMLFNAASERRSENTNNAQAVAQPPKLIINARAYPTPSPTPNAPPEPSPTTAMAIIRIPRVTPTPPTPDNAIRQDERLIVQPTPIPTPDVPRLGRPMVVINTQQGLRDGGGVGWNLPPGYYQLELTSANDGARVEWVGTAFCDFKTKDMLRFTQRCKMLRQGTLQVTNPTTFGLGAAIVVTVKVTRF